MQRNDSVRRGTSVFLAALLIAATPAGADDEIANICEAGEGVPGYGACECALGALKDELGDGEFDIYTSVSILYFEKMNDGMEMGQAWTEAVRSVGDSRDMSSAEILNITNPIGRVHMNANKDCQS